MSGFMMPELDRPDKPRPTEPQLQAAASVARHRAAQAMVAKGPALGLALDLHDALVLFSAGCDAYTDHVARMYGGGR